MRLWTILILTVVTTGCNTVAPTTQRQIALMRSEILDLGDMYGDLKSRHRRALTELAECRGEPIPSSLLDYDETYYPEGQLLGSGVVHTGTADCCADCGRAFQAGILPGETIISMEPTNLSPNPAQGRSVVEPITQPFDDSREPILSREESNDQSMQPNNRRNLSDTFRKARQRISNFAQTNRIPDAEPSFRPDDPHWSPRKGARGETNLARNESTIQDTRDGTPWRKTSNVRQQPLSNTPIDDRYLDSDPELQPLEFQGTFGNVQQILIDPENTFAFDYDRDGQDDGIQVLIQPLDQDGNIVNRASDLVISVIDANEVGTEQRIGLWKYKAYQTESFVSTERGRRGLMVELPWQRRTPKNSDLVVFVRYQSNTGAQLESSLDVKIRPPHGPEMDGSVAKQPEAQPAAQPTGSQKSAHIPEWRPVR